MKLTEKYSWPELVKITQEKAKIKEKGFDKFMSKQEHVGYNFDPIMWKRCFNIAQELKNDHDHFMVVSGMEGSGKTTFAAQICACANPERFTLKHICFKMDDFITGLKTAQAGDVFLLDEGAMFLFSREAMSTDNKMMVKLFTIMRQLNIFVVICIPNFWTIDSYIRDHRVKTLVNVTERGKYRAYTGLGIKILSKEGSRFKSFNRVRVPYGNFWDGYFVKDIPTVNDITPESYKEHKSHHMRQFLNDLEQDNRQIKEKRLMTLKEYSREYTGQSYDMARLRATEGKIPAKKINGRWYVDREKLNNELLL